jgi:alanine racemase
VTSVRPTVVEVDLGAIRYNAGVLAPAHAALLAVVKADAYGHGAVPVARAALEGGATWLGVALVEEGLTLREAGIEAPILLLSEAPPGSEAVVIAGRLTPTLYSRGGLERLATAARGARIGVHVKVDTGMHRVGIWPPGDALAYLEEVLTRGLEVEGVWTHFASSQEDADLTARQLQRLSEVVAGARAAGIEPRVIHAANSAATILHPETHQDLVRVGIALYGVAPAPGVGADLGLRPAMSWRSEVGHVKRLAAGERISYDLRYPMPADGWVATVPVGYADGYPRAATGVAQVLIGGARRPVAGSITMDQLMVDCGDREPALGEEVVLLGAQGAERIDAWELGGWAGTIGYEIVTRVGPRVPRRYEG